MKKNIEYQTWAKLKNETQNMGLCLYLHGHWGRIIEINAKKMRLYSIFCGYTKFFWSFLCAFALKFTQNGQGTNKSDKSCTCRKEPY